MKELDILTSLQPVVFSTKYVKINTPKLEEKIKILFAKFNHSQKWHMISPMDNNSLTPEERAAFLIIFNSISFSYFGNPKWNISPHYNRGTINLIASIDRARKENIPIFNSDYLAELDNLGFVLRGGTQIPLLKEREQIIREIGSVISRKYNKSFLNFLSSAGNTAIDLVNSILDNFPSFYDSSIYLGKEVLFHKRAQLLASDLAYFFGFSGIEHLTACADYILPMVLRYHQIIEYDHSLASKVDSNIEIPKDSQEEIEIRASTIWAVELIKNKIGFDSMKLNDYLWLEGDNVPLNQQYHLTRTIAY